MSTALTLYELEDNLLALTESEAMTQDDEQQHLAILQEIAQASQAAVQKRDNLVRFFRHLDCQDAAIDAEIKRLRDLKDHNGKARERLEKYVIGIIEQFVPAPKRGAKKLEGSIGVLSLRSNPPSVEIIDEAVIPAEFLVTPPPPAARPDKKAIKEAIQAGREVPGADLSFGSMRLEVK